jgi:hypothetical protein
MVDFKITAVITTSPIPTHPSTAFIDAVYGSIRHHLPNCPILILADGVREEQNHLADDYAKYKQSLHQKNWTNVQILEFDSFHHQAGMIRTALAQGAIQTPLIFWVEHDFPMNYTFIDWGGVVNTLLDREVDCIRFCHDPDTNLFTRPHQKDQFQQLTGEPMHAFVSRCGLPLLTVLNMDTPPHVARTDFYQWLLTVFKEAKIHVDCVESNQLIERSWPQKKVSLYVPEGNIKKFENLKGRGNEPKYPMTL